MKRYALAVSLLLTALVVLAMESRPAHSETRPVAFASGPLQGYFNSLSELIDVLNAQVPEAECWGSTISGNSAVTLMLELADDADGNIIGVYDAGLDVLGEGNHYPIFPGSASAGHFAVASFRTGPNRLIVNLFDQNAQLVGAPVTYPGVSIQDFGYYIQNSTTGRGYSQEARNAGAEARVLVYKGVGVNVGNWWLCFEDKKDQEGIARDFDDAVLFVESINPTAVSKTTWGALKSRFR